MASLQTFCILVVIASMYQVMAANPSCIVSPNASTPSFMPDYGLGVDDHRRSFDAQCDGLLDPQRHWLGRGAISYSRMLLLRCYVCSSFAFAAFPVHLIP